MGIAQFLASIGKGLFLYKVTFQRVPEFSAAHFEEAPQFDNVSILDRKSKNGLNESTYQYLPSQWRALKRLAIQGHDYERELEFFKGEITARRGTQDKWNHARYWAGFLYQWVSDFGQSIMRPLLLFAFSLAMFFGIYSSQNYDILSDPLSASIPCKVGPGDPRLAALSLAIYNSVPFARVRTPRQVEQLYACLYGVDRDGGSQDRPMLSGVSAIVPFWITFFGTVQIFVSTVLIFLIVLAVRNHFKIK